MWILSALILRNLEAASALTPLCQVQPTLILHTLCNYSNFTYLTFSPSVHPQGMETSKLEQKKMPLA